MSRGAWRAAATGLAAAAVLAGCGSGPAPDPAGPSAEPVAGPLAAQPDAQPDAARPRTTKVLLVVEENHSLAQVQRSMPYLASLAAQYSYATGYRAVAHPSLPNYLMLAGGSTAGVTDDASPSAHPLHGTSVFGQALARGRGATVYAQSMTGTCRTTSSGGYVVRHTAWPYYVDERADCLKHQVPAGTPTQGALHDDVAAGRLPAVGWLVPDLAHDAHDGSLATADAYLRSWLPQVLRGPDFTSGRLAVVITTDEDDRHSGNAVLTVVVAPGLSHRVVTTPLTHASLSGLFSQVVGAPRLRSAVTAPSFANAFGLRVGP